MPTFKSDRYPLYEMLFNDLKCIDPSKIGYIMGEFPQYISDAKDYRIAMIKDIKQHGLATIIYSYGNRKTVVHCQDDELNPQLGLYMCLLKYLISSKIYSSCVDYIFNNSIFSYEKTSMALGMLLSHIDQRDFDKIYAKFIEGKED